MLVTVNELEKTELYPEIIQAITRRDNSAAELQILAAESLVRSYMSRYDKAAIFGTAEAEPTFRGADLELIKKVVKTIASYYLVRKANPNVDIELFRLDYQDAIVWLERLQEGKVNPDLPYVKDDPETSIDESATELSWKSNLKRKNHF